MRRIAPYGVHLYEEPLPPQDFRGYELLCARAPIPVATGEALYTVWDFDRLIEARAVDVVQPDLTLCGGLDQAKAIALLCQLHNLRFSPHVWGTRRRPRGRGPPRRGAARTIPHTDHVPGAHADRVRRRRQPAARSGPDQPLRPVNGRIAVPEAPASASSSTRRRSSASGSTDADRRWPRRRFRATLPAGC